MTPNLQYKHQFQKAFLNEPQLQKLLLALGGDGAQVRVVGGAVRNTLRGASASDLDVATLHQPKEIMSRASKAGFKTVPTGIEHGTITVIGDDFTCEVTTLREDVETDGRHAVVRFGSSWLKDAERRDFTMNAMSVDKDGALFDLVAGLDDCLSGNVRFIGDAQLRIKEDALRALRFFRFSARFGDGQLDADGTRAAAEATGLMAHLSVERVQQELKKLLAAPGPAQLCLALNAARPLLKEFGIDVGPDDISPLAVCHRPDPLLRLALLMKGQTKQLLACLKTLRFSNADIALLNALTVALDDLAASDVGDRHTIRLKAYRHGAGTIDDAVYLLTRSASEPDHSYQTTIVPLENWIVPTFPIKGADLLSEGFKPGPSLGIELSSLEASWIAQRFELPRDELLAMARSHLEAEPEQ
ncbi:MAG: CCA tRNA nucleotidyltransferase [Hyphomicrobiales bacterium]